MALVAFISTVATARWRTQFPWLPFVPGDPVRPVKTVADLAIAAQRGVTFDGSGIPWTRTRILELVKIVAADRYFVETVDDDTPLPGSE